MIKKANRPRKNTKLLNVLCGFIACVSFPIFASECEGSCWKPELNFDIEGKGFLPTMIFISGHSYSLSASTKALLQQGKQNFFCNKLNVSSKELIDILNKKLNGEVTSEQVSDAITDGLMERYPCDS